MPTDRDVSPTASPAGPSWARPANRMAGRVTIVTGAARGIGRAVARRYAREGALVYAVDRVADELEGEVDALRAEGHQVFSAVLDLRDDEAIASLLERVERDVRRLDVLANVAGIIALEPLESTSVETFDAIVAINLRAPFLLMRAAAPLLRRSGGGVILNVSSRAGIVGSALEAAYCASKFGLEGLSRAAARDLEGAGIVVNTVTPGIPTRTAMSETTYGPEARAQWRDPDDITPAFVHLATQTPSGLHDLRVDAWALSERLRAERG